MGWMGRFFATQITLDRGHHKMISAAAGGRIICLALRSEGFYAAID